MKAPAKFVGLTAAALVIAVVSGASASAQSPASVAPVIVDTAAPIIINAVSNVIKPKTIPGVGKFEGFVMHANIAQITVRARGNDAALQTFSLSERASAQMQTIVDKGGYQYGDKVTIYYDQVSLKALKVKGKPSKAI